MFSKAHEDTSPEPLMTVDLALGACDVVAMTASCKLDGGISPARGSAAMTVDYC
jgi:hypothetical protein